MIGGMQRQDVSAIVERVIADRPVFHRTDRETADVPKHTPVRWNAQAETLRLISRHAGPGCRSIEIGSGASTVVFAAAGGEHTAVAPFLEEYERISEYCESIGVSTANVDFIADSSDRALPGLDPSARVDLAFIDGTHAFPYAIVEWHFLRRHIAIGGILLLDDVPVPSVAVLHRFLTADPDWEQTEIADRRAVAFRKVGETAEATWRDQPFNDSYPDHRFMSPTERVRAGTRHRFRMARSRAARRFPGLRRRYRQFRWRSKKIGSSPPGAS